MIPQLDLHQRPGLLLSSSYSSRGGLPENPLDRILPANVQGRGPTPWARSKMPHIFGGAPCPYGVPIRLMKIRVQFDRVRLREITAAFISRSLEEL